MANARHAGYAAVGIVLCLIFFQLTPADMWVQQLFRSADGQTWLLEKNAGLSNLIFYDGIKTVLIGLGLMLLAVLLCGRRLTSIKPYRRGMRIVLLALILVPACVGALKNTTNVACPRDIVEFGGQAEHRGLLAGLAEKAADAPHYRCFPAGHASGGFALLSLFFLFRTARNRYLAVSIAAGIGWTMGLYKMAIGDHFISHTLVTMCLAWLIINLIVIFDDRIAALTSTSGLALESNHESKATTKLQVSG